MRAAEPLAFALILLALQGCGQVTNTNVGNDPAPKPAAAKPGPQLPTPAIAQTPRTVIAPNAATPVTRQAALVEECVRHGQRAVLSVLFREQECRVWDLRALLEQVDRDEDAYYRAWESGRLPPGALARDHAVFQRARARYDNELDRAQAELSRLQVQLDAYDRRQAGR